MALDLNTIYYCVISTRSVSAERLHRLASGIVPPGKIRTPGKNEARHLSYLAGRAALDTLFDALGIRAVVEPELARSEARHGPEPSDPRAARGAEVTDRRRPEIRGDIHFDGA